MGIRLNKFLSLCGLGSRRKVEELISNGRISINSELVVKQGVIVQPDDIVKLDNRKISPAAEFTYIILNKPKGYITTVQDEKGRPTVMDLLHEKHRRAQVFPVGRLDKNTEGLLLLTNDGDLAYKLTEPRYKVSKEYIVEIDRSLENEDRLKIQKGLFIHQLKVKTRGAKINSVDTTGKRIKVIITEGKKRQIRYTFKNLGYRVQKLTRTAYGNLTLTGINKGDFRQLRKNELAQLKESIKKPFRNK